MSFRSRWGRQAVSCMVALSMVCVVTAAPVGTPSDSPESPSPVPVAQDPLSPFTAEEMRGFLAALKSVSDVADPIQRCEAFPDPPGSHWSREGTAAYCRYRRQVTMGFDELKRLVDSGKADEVDRRLGAWAKDAQGHPAAVWRFLYVNFFFSRGPEGRRVLEAWKQQRPDSAYAYAASGYSFVRDGWAVRGGELAKETPQLKFDAMENLLARADGDLRRALKLDPGLGEAYASLLELGMLEGDRQTMKEAMTEGLRIAPTCYGLYEALLQVTRPQWFGSTQAQAALIATVDRQAVKEPLLLVIRSGVLADQAQVTSCECTTHSERAAYRTAFDQVGPWSTLMQAGLNALDNKQYELAVVYLAESLRFEDHPDIEQRMHEAMDHLDPSLRPH